jgi:hypothetical protein
VHFFEFSPRANIDDFHRLAGFEQSFEFEWMNCFHTVPSDWKRMGIRAPPLISPWLLPGISCHGPQRKERSDSVLLCTARRLLDRQLS